jgi:hypothetical protein
MILPKWMPILGALPYQQPVLSGVRFPLDKGLKSVTLTTVFDYFGRLGMSLQAHLVTLKKRHEALQKDIETEQNHPGGNDLKIAEMKRKKMAIKQEMERLQAGAPVAATAH